MSLWLRKTSELEEYARKRAYWGAIILYLFAVTLLFICFMPQKHTVSLSIPRRATSAPVMFHSWGKRGASGIGRAQRLVGARHLIKQRKMAHKNRRAEHLVKKENKQQIAVPLVKKSPREKIEKKEVKTSKALPQTPSIEKKSAEKKALKKTLPAEQSKQTIKEPPKIPIKTPLEKKQAPQKHVEKKTEPEPELQLDDEIEENEEDEEVEVDAAFGVSEDGSVFDEEGLSREGLAVMRSVGRVWRPPRGLSPLLSARLIISLQKNGSIEKIIIEKKSGVLAFDMAARAALWRAEYPSVFWGKNIAVIFGRVDS